MQVNTVRDILTSVVIGSIRSVVVRGMAVVIPYWRDLLGFSGIDHADCESRRPGSEALPLATTAVRRDQPRLIQLCQALVEVRDFGMSMSTPRLTMPRSVVERLRFLSIKLVTAPGVIVNSVRTPAPRAISELIADPANGPAVRLARLHNSHEPRSGYCLLYRRCLPGGGALVAPIVGAPAGGIAVTIFPRIHEFSRDTSWERCNMAQGMR